LRKQKFQIALLNEDMKIYLVVDAFTSDRGPRTLITELVGVNKPYAYLLNYNSHGYAQFKIDD
jgi:hypothetical protein